MDKKPARKVSKCLRNIEENDPKISISTNEYSELLLNDLSH